MIKVRKALLSVTDKSGLEDLAIALKSLEIELIASQGTGELLQDLGISFTPLAELSGYKHAFGGRCKSLSLQVMGGLLFDRVKHRQEAESLGINPIDMVVCNLYDFASAWQKQLAPEQLIEQIDIGGVALLRASAKNHKFVICASDPADYPQLIAELKANAGKLSQQTSAKLAVKSFVACSEYDRLVALGIGGQSLRYGENPHQKAWSYPLPEFGFFGLRCLQGKHLSYNNYLDIKAAIESLQSLEGNGCVIVKHGNPCGFCVNTSSTDSLLEAAWAGDPISAFGSIIAFSYAVDAQDLAFLALEKKKQAKFVEAVIAPEFTPSALQYLAQKKHLRACSYHPQAIAGTLAFRQLDTLLLAQEADKVGSEHLQVVVGDTKGLDAQLVGFGTRAVQALSSNAIAIVHRHTTGQMSQVAMGCGQPNRLDAIELAIKKLNRSIASGDFTGRAEDCYLISDAFLPFADNVQAVAKCGIQTIVQPGGSIRDKQVLAACQQLSLRMVLTGVRHFRH